MAKGFRRTRRGIRARLDEQERGLLAHLVVEVHDLLAEGQEPAQAQDPLAAMIGIGTAVDPPQDPALARLLPDAHRDDRQASAEFRRYTEAGLRERKQAGLEVARRTLGRDGPLLLDDAEAQAWVVALTDIRLVIASRIGVQTDEDYERLAAQAQAEVEAAGGAAGAEPSGLAFMLAVYDFLTWLQETLVGALSDPAG